jgi:hypothetical protein
MIFIWAYIFVLGKYLEVRILHHMVTICVALEEMVNLCLKGLNHYAFPPTVYESSKLSLHLALALCSDVTPLGRALNHLSLP